MAGRKPKYETLEQVREAQREASAKWYSKNRDKRLQQMRDYYNKNKESGKNED